MDRNAAVAQVQLGLGFRSDKSDEIIGYLEQAQKEFETGETLPHWLRLEDQALALYEGNSTVSLPAEFLREVEREGPWRIASTTNEIFSLKRYTDFVGARTLFASTDPGAPVAYCLRESVLHFFPVADADYTLYWSYYQKAQGLSANVENLWLRNAPYKLIGRAGMLMAEVLGDDRALRFFTTMFERNSYLSIAETIERDWSNAPTVMGSEQ